MHDIAKPYVVKEDMGLSILFEIVCRAGHRDQSRPRSRLSILFENVYHAHIVGYDLRASLASAFNSI